jgi:tRNA G46 methylase TrmB
MPAPIWASPLIVDDKVYVGDEDGNMTVFQLAADPKCAEPIATMPMGSSIVSSPVYANGTLYAASRNTLYAVDAAAAGRWHEQAGNWPQWRGPDRDKHIANAIFVPTPHDVVEKMLAAAHIRKNDIVYDLGSGDGRIPIEAAKKHQCKAIGLEIDRDLVKLSRARVEEAKLEKLVTINEADLFSTDFSDATVVTVYLFPDLLKRLVPKFEKLKPGTRIVSHQFQIPEIPPEKTIVVESVETGAKHTVYLWTTPLRK